MASGVQIGSLAVGTSVFADFNGSKTEFIIVHQGKPSSLYDESCNGTWLLKKTYVYQSGVSDSVFNPTGSGTSRNCFKDSNIYTTLNGTILNLFGDSIKSAIKTAKIPYSLSDYQGTVKGGSEGLSSKVFLLSGYEVGFTTYQVNSEERLPADGAKLSYFESGEGSSACEKRLFCDSSGSAKIWWLRSADASYHDHVICTSASGACDMQQYTSTLKVRPAVILDSSALVDTSDYSILGLPSKKHKTLIGGTGYEITGGRTLVGGTWYSISKGRTLVDGTGYDISIGPGAIPVTITGSGAATYCQVVINGQTYTSAASGIEVSAGDVITFRVYSAQKSTPGKVTINGEVVASVTGTVDGNGITHEWTVPKGCASISIQLYIAKGSLNRKLYTTATVTTT